MLLNSIFVFCIGLVFGSFMSVLIFRLGKKEGILMGRSECPVCLSQLKWYDLFPLFSYFQLKGKCRYCSVNIPVIYPLIELATGLLFLTIFLTRWPALNIHFFFELVIGFFLLFIFFYDFLYFLIPDKITFPLIGAALLYNFIFRIKMFENLLVTGMLMGLFFAIMYMISQGRWMGLGDAKLVLLLGLIFGYPIGFWVIVFSVWAAAIVGITLIIIGKASFKTALPFGTFLSIVSIIFILFGNDIQSKAQFINGIF